jgi:thiol-disulfide isomerase/thioredoxin
MRMHFRLPILSIGVAAILYFSCAALAQTPAVSAAKQLDGVPSISARLSRRLFPVPSEPLSFGPRPRGCFCDEDCLAALQEKERIQSRQRFQSMPPWPPLYTHPENEIRVIDLDGLKKILQRDPKDSRPLLINFWATWCDPCREEFPDLVKIDADYRSKGLNFVAVSLDDITDIKIAVPKFLNEMKATMPVVLLNVNDPEPAIKAVDDQWDGQLPATFLYDKDGKVIFRHFGKIKPDELRTVLDKVVVNKQ